MIRIHQDRRYFATLQDWYLPYRKMQVDVLPACDAAPSHFISSLEKPGSGTIADVPALDDTGISSVTEESSVSALTAGKPKAADKQEEKDERVHTAFVNRPFSDRMMMLSSTHKSLPAYYLLRQVTKKPGLSVSCHRIGKPV